MNASGKFAVILALVLAASVAARADMVYSWSMESDTPEVYPAGSDITPTYSPSNRRTTDFAHSGSYSLDISGGYALASLENPTNEDVWAYTNEGAISLWWTFDGSEVLTGNRMLAMIDGKCKEVPALDTNEALMLSFRGYSRQLRLTYGWIDDSGYHTTRVTYTHPEDWVANEWHNVVFKWDTDTAPSLSLQVDGGTPVTGGSAIGSTTMVSFHHLLWGNDTHNSGEGLYLDDVEVWDDFEMTPEPASALLLALSSLLLTKRRRRVAMSA